MLCGSPVVAWCDVHGESEMERHGLMVLCYLLRLLCWFDCLDQQLQQCQCMAILSFVCWLSLAAVVVVRGRESALFVCVCRWIDREWELYPMYELKYASW